MRPLLVAVLLHAVTARAADCASGYANYETAWAITQAQWDADCSSGQKPDEILKKRQQAFMDECAAYYRPFLAKARLEEWNLQVYCAQGAAGEGKLSAMTSAPLRRPPPTPKDTAPAAPLTPGRRYYNSVDTLGSELPRNWTDLPGGILNNPQLRAFSGISHTMYVNLAMRPPLCIMDVTGSIAIVSGRCGPDEPYIKMIVDKGCTGKIANMTFTDEQKRPMRCGQTRVDEIFTALDAAYTQGRSRNGK